MSFSPAFTVSQSAASPSVVVFTDTSIGSDPLITKRRIFITDNNGDYIVPSGTTTDYIDWPLATNPLSVDLLLQDTACEIEVLWLNSVNATLYSSSDKFCLSQFNQQFFYYLIQQLALTPSILQDTSYKSNLSQFWTYVIGAQNAVQIGGDIASSQQLLDMATLMQQNQQMYF